MVFDPKDSNSGGGEQQFDPNDIISSRPIDVQQNSIDDFNDLKDKMPNFEKGSSDQFGEKGSDSNKGHSEKES
jgi:hypothetical protein